MKNLLHFDPLLYLEINDVTEEEKINLRYLLLEKVSEYIFLRSLELLPANKASSFASLTQVFSYCQQNIPAYNEKIAQFLQDFKKEFSKG